MKHTNPPGWCSAIIIAYYHTQYITVSHTLSHRVYSITHSNTHYHTLSWSHTLTLSHKLAVMHHTGQWCLPVVSLCAILYLYYMVELTQNRRTEKYYTRAAGLSVIGNILYFLGNTVFFLTKWNLISLMNSHLTMHLTILPSGKINISLGKYWLSSICTVCWCLLKGVNTEKYITAGDC